MERAGDRVGDTYQGSRDKGGEGVEDGALGEARRREGDV